MEVGYFLREHLNFNISRSVFLWEMQIFPFAPLTFPWEYNTTSKRALPPSVKDSAYSPQKIFSFFFDHLAAHQHEIKLPFTFIWKSSKLSTTHLFQHPHIEVQYQKGFILPSGKSSYNKKTFPICLTKGSLLKK